MPPALPLPGPPAGESFLSRSSLLTDRNRNGSTPMSWLHVIGFVLVLWAAASDAMAQAREILVTEVRGSVVRAGSTAVRALDVVKPGDRLRLGLESQVSVFVSDEAQVYVIDGPAEVSIAARSVLANGKPVAARKLDEGYRGVKVTPELVQGSLVMRSAQGVRLEGPEGPVAAADARTYRWRGDGNTLRFELASESGELVHRAIAVDRVSLPAEVAMKPGRYVWGVSPVSARAAPLDWTEIDVRGDASASPERPAPTASATERLLYAAWLRAHAMPRAAERAARAATQGTSVTSP